MINVAQCKGIRIPESREFFSCGIRNLGLAILNTAQGIWNPTLMRLESGIQVQLIKNHGTETSTFNPESTALIRDCLGFTYMGRLLMIPDSRQINGNQRQTINMLSVLRNRLDISYQYQH